jgi:hypothetical protein
VLRSAVDNLDILEDLEIALVTADDAGSAELEERIAGRLEDLFPGSPGVRRRQRRALIAARDYAGVAAMLAGETDGEASAEFFGRLVQFLSRPDTPDYPALVASAGSDTALADALRMACVRDALQRQLIVHAFELVVPMPKTPAQGERWERLLFEVLEATSRFARRCRGSWTGCGALHPWPRCGRRWRTGPRRCGRGDRSW